MQRRMFSASAVVGAGIALALLTASPSTAASGPSGREAAAQCRTADFTTAAVAPLASTAPVSSPTRYRLTVSGYAVSSNESVTLVPLIYVRQPDYWGIQVTGCSSGPGLPVIVPYTATYDFTGPLGRCGIEVVGASKQQRFDLARCASVPLPGTSWVLDPAGLGVPVPTNATITAKFSDTTVSGSTSCGTYQADYSAGTDGAFKVGRVASPPSVCDVTGSRAETAYLAKLSSANQYRATASELNLLVDGTPVLRYVAAKSTGPTTS
jgi:hypothetical protein